MGYILSNRDSSQGPGRVLSMDAVSQLKADHRRIQRLFYRLGSQGQTRELTALVQSICDQLTIYLTLKEELVYPCLRHASHTLSQQSQVDESVVEHFSLKVIMETLDGQAPGDPLFTAKVCTLKRHFVRYAEDEERRLFPEIPHLLLNDLSRKIRERRRQLRDKLAAEEKLQAPVPGRYITGL